MCGRKFPNEITKEMGGLFCHHLLTIAKKDEKETKIFLGTVQEDYFLRENKNISNNEITNHNHAAH